MFRFGDSGPVFLNKRTKAGCEYEQLQNLVCLSSGLGGTVDSSRTFKIFPKILTLVFFKRILTAGILSLSIGSWPGL